MATINFYVGTNDKDTHDQEMSYNDMDKIIVDTFSLFYDCFSMDMIRGVYKKEIETTFRVTLIKELDEKDDSNFNDIIETLKYVLNQECILVEYIDSHSKLV